MCRKITLVPFINLTRDFFLLTFGFIKFKFTDKCTTRKRLMRMVKTIETLNSFI